MDIHTYWYRFLKLRGYYNPNGKPSLTKTASAVHEMIYGEHKGFPSSKVRSFLKNEKDRRQYKAEEIETNLKGKVVYFIGNRDHSVVKIGRTTNIFKRLKEVQTGCPFNLKILGYIETKAPKKTERKMHQYYRRYRLRGEWFKLTDRIEAFLEELDNSVPYVF